MKVEIEQFNAFLEQWLESRWISAKVVCYIKKIILFISFMNFFFSLMSSPCYNNLLPIKGLKGFKRFFYSVKTFASRDNALWYCFKWAKQYIFPYLIKSIRIPENQSSFKILEIFDKLRHQRLMIILSFLQFFCNFNLKRIRSCLSDISAQSSFSLNVT